MKIELRRVRSWTAACALAAATACTPAPELHVVSGDAQGTTYSLQWWGGGTEAEVAAAAEIELARSTVQTHPAPHWQEFLAAWG